MGEKVSLGSLAISCTIPLAASSCSAAVLSAPRSPTREAMAAGLAGEATGCREPITEPAVEALRLGDTPAEVRPRMMDDRFIENDSPAVVDVRPRTKDDRFVEGDSPAALSLAHSIRVEERLSSC